MHVLDDVDALEGAVLGGQAAGDLDVAIDDSKEGKTEQGAKHNAVGDAPPKDGAQSDLAEPQPVDVVDGEKAQRDNGDDRRDNRDGQAAQPGPANGSGESLPLVQAN